MQWCAAKSVHSICTVVGHTAAAHNVNPLHPGRHACTHDMLHGYTNSNANTNTARRTDRQECVRVGCAGIVVHLLFRCKRGNDGRRIILLSCFMQHKVNRGPITKLRHGRRAQQMSCGGVVAPIANDQLYVKTSSFVKIVVIFMS